MKTYEYCNFGISEECAFVINLHTENFNEEGCQHNTLLQIKKINVNGIFYLRKFSQSRRLLTGKENMATESMRSLSSALTRLVLPVAREGSRDKQETQRLRGRSRGIRKQNPSLICHWSIISLSNLKIRDSDLNSA